MIARITKLRELIPDTARGKENDIFGGLVKRTIGEY
jgi:hypothetical protein